MKPKMESNPAPLSAIGVDIGKEVFHLVGFGVDGKIAFRRRIRRLGLKDAFEKLPGNVGEVQQKPVRRMVMVCG